MARLVRMLLGLSMLATGCAEPTTVLVEVRLGAAAAIPETLFTNVYDSRGRIARDHTVQMPTFPGTLLISGLPHIDQPLRVVMRGEAPGGDTLGGERVAVRAHEQTRLTLTLTGGRADNDGDGVPDDLDSCLTVADAEQRDQDADGSGDACEGTDAGVPDLAEAGSDLRAPDLATADLADGSMSDLSGPSCAKAMAALCEDFEAATIHGRWQQVKKHASLTLDSSRAFRGAQSLHIHLDAIDAGDSAQGEIYETQTFQPSPMPNFFVRAYLYLPGPAPTDDVPRLLGALQTNTPFEGISVNLENGNFTTFNSIPSPSDFNGSTTALPVNQWACVEWQVQIGTPGLLKVWLNETEIAALGMPQDTAIVPALGQIVLGYYFAVAPVDLTARDLWIDEIIIDGQRVGCAK